MIYIKFIEKINDKEKIKGDKDNEDSSCTSKFTDI